MHPLAARVIDGDVRALARVCRLVDDARDDHVRILKDLFPHTGHAWSLGVTGMPGAGKSTLTDKLIGAFRADGLRVGVLAIDPTSPFSGGAILGDRIRMQRHHADREVFIRSIATRGSLGGLSRSAADMVRVVDAWRADVVIVETVGVGQDELEVSRTVDTTLVVMAPGMGDDVQAIKAGILECADVFAVNKADRDGAQTTARQLELMISLGHTVKNDRSAPATHASWAASQAREASSSTAVDGEWTPPISLCVATRNDGVDEIVVGLRAHREWLHGTEAGRLRRLDRLRDAMRNQLRNTLIDCATESMHAEIEGAVRLVDERRIDPYTAAEQLVAAFRDGRK